MTIRFTYAIIDTLMNKTKKFRLATLGCRTNQYETQGFRDQLLALGFSEAAEDEAADLCVVNTCTVTESADKSSLHQIRQFVKQNPEGNVVVTGCFAEREDLITKIGGNLKIVRNKEKEHLVADLFPDVEVPEFSIKNFEAHTRAFVKVQDGCNSFCTYCIIPYVRGRSRSRPLSEILTEIRGLIAAGYKDVVITGINVGDYEDEGKNLAHLVRQVDKVEGLERLRISSIDPDEVDDDLLDAVVNGKKTCPSLHIVLQSGSNVILKKMNRKYTRQIFLNTVDRLKKAVPDFTFTTDVIVGFPGETECDIQETLDVMKEVKFAKVHMFPYSPRARTRAALYPNQIPAEIIKERKRRVMQLAEETAFQLREEYVGRTMTVLSESEENGNFLGHTDNFLTVLFSSPGQSSNKLIPLHLIENTPQGLIGVPV